MSGSPVRAPIGVAHGRFQLFHNHHLRYVLAAKRMCEHLVIGITSPILELAPHEGIAPHRKQDAANPLSYYERLSMISACMFAAGLSCREFSITPFPIESPHLLHNYAPSHAVCYITIYDLWGEEKARRLSRAGFNVHVLWRSDIKEISGSQIRADIRAGASSWLEMMPPAAVSYVQENGIVDRIRDA
jgi:cytidyltransferase-like protein